MIFLFWLGFRTVFLETLSDFLAGFFLALLRSTGALAAEMGLTDVEESFGLTEVEESEKVGRVPAYDDIMNDNVLQKSSYLYIE